MSRSRAEEQIELGFLNMHFGSISGINHFINLLNSLPDVNIRDQEGKTLLMLLVATNLVQWLDILLQHNVEIQLQDHEGKTALIYASKYGHLDMMDRLIMNNANLDTKDYEGNTALIYAVKNCQLSIICELIQRGADLNIQNYNGFTALMYASRYGIIDECDILINAGADLDIKDNQFGWNALMYSFNLERIEMFNLLVKANADLNTKDSDGNNILKLVIQNNLISDDTKLYCINILLEHRADVYAEDNNYHNAMFHAKQNFMSCIELLKQYDHQLKFDDHIVYISGETD